MNFAKPGVLLTAVAGLCFAGGKLTTTSSVVFSKNPASLGDVVTVTAIVSPTATSPGILMLERYYVNGLPASCSVRNGSFSLVNDVMGAPISSVSAAGSTSAVGKFGYRASFTPTGGSGKSVSPCADLIVNPPGAATAELQIAVLRSSGTNMPVAGEVWSGSFTIVVANSGSTAARGVAAQGEASPWTSLVSYYTHEDNAAITKFSRNGSKALLWDLGDVAAQEFGHLEVNVSGLIPAGTPSGTVLNINRGWSVRSKDGSGAGYASPLLITVE